MSSSVGVGTLWAAIPETPHSDDHHRLAVSIDHGKTWTVIINAGR